MTSRFITKIVFTEAAGDFHRLYDQSLAITRMSKNNRRQRYYIVDQLAQKVTAGHVAECGVYKGASAYIIASRIQDVPNIQFHLFDSFKGLSAFGEADEITTHTKRFEYPLKKVRRNLKDFAFIKYYPGWIPQRFEEVGDLRFSFVHIDVDLYQPTFDCLAFFYPRLIEKGMMAFDDYGTDIYPGARKAIDEYLADKNDHFFMNTPAGEGVLLKWRQSP